MQRHRIFARNLAIQIEQPDIESLEEGKEIEGAYRDEKGLLYATIKNIENQKRREIKEIKMPSIFEGIR